MPDRPPDAAPPAPHVVLLGDSIFDNEAYVGSDPCVTVQLREALRHADPPWAEGRVALLAVDGARTEDVARQIATIPADATHLVLSSGGNDALSVAGLLTEEFTPQPGLFTRLAEVQERFHKHYSGLLERLARTGRPVLVCTIYDACPGMGRHFLRPTADPIEPAVRAEIDRHVGRVIRTMLSIFNDVIVRQATRQRMPVVELRDLLTEPEDFSDLSPIEPSARGGQKLADALVATLAGRASSPGRAGRG